MKNLYKCFIILALAFGSMPFAFSQGPASGGTVVVGSGTGTTNGAYFPISMWHRYTWTQQIFTFDELQTIGEVASVSFQYFYGTEYTRDITVYLGITDKTSFNNSSYYIPVNQLTQVFDGPVTFNNAGEDYWVTIDLTQSDEHFYYSGEGNLVLAMYDHTGSYNNSDPKFYTHNTTDNKTLFYRTDNYFTPDSPSGTNGVLAYRSNTKFVFEVPDCPPPAMNVTNIDAISAVVSWTPGVENSDCIMQYKKMSDAEFTDIDVTGGSPVTLTGLTSLTDYVVRMRTECGEGVSSIFIYRYFTTPDFPVLSVTPETLAMGERPSGKWMEPMMVTVQNTGGQTTVTNISVSDGYFLLDTPATPFSLGSTPLQIAVSTGVATGEKEAVITLQCNPDVTLEIPVSATGYAAVSPDVWELPCMVTTWPYTASFTSASNLHNVYHLPGAEPDGKDAVFKFVLASDMLVDAEVVSGDNGKIAIYRENFEGQGGPMATNSYAGLMEYSGCDFESGDFCDLGWENDPTYPWVVSSNAFYQGLYGMVSGNGGAHSTSSSIEITLDIPQSTTVSFYAKVSSEGGSDKGWFYIDGTAMINGISGLGDWIRYEYPVGAGQHTFKWEYTKSGSYNSNDDCFYVDNIDFGGLYSANGVFPQGTYYLVASSTSDNFTVNINSVTAPLPEAVTDMWPEDGYAVYNATSVDLSWALGRYTREYQLLIGETNPPVDVAVDWTNDLAEAYTLSLQNNKTYYWQVKERNSSGVTVSPICSFSSNQIIPSANNIIYVTQTGAGTKTGDSWANAAVGDLNAVLSIANSLSSKPAVWVAEGTYTGDVAANNAFTMYPGVNVYGGFAGTETTMEERDYASHPTILDGQRMQRVLFQPAAFTEATAAVWDGFVIEKGRVYSANGAGVYLRQYGTLRNSIIRNDTIISSSKVYGGGVCMDDGTLDNCEIYGNYVKSTFNGGNCGGGGVYANNGTITNCDIHDNMAQGHNDYSYAGGVYAYHTNLSGCFIHGNESSGCGGGLYIEGYSENNRSLLEDCRIEGNTSCQTGGVRAIRALITNCIIANNTATGSKGGGVYTYGCYLINCAIVNNRIVGSSSYNGAGICVWSSTDLVNSVLWGNRMGGTVNNIYDGGLTATYCALESAFLGTGNIQISSLNTGNEMSPMFTAPTEGVGADFTGGDWTLQEGSVLINKGDNSAANLPDHDFLGNDRIQQDRVDIGPYETPYTSSIMITPDANNIIYVSVEGAGTKDGSSWANAASNPNFVIAMASTMSPLPTIWMKEGTYVGDSVADGNAFTMCAGMNVYGGFGGTETTLEERDYASHPTILDGQRVQRVLFQPAAFTEATAAVWDGFIIENGRLTSETDGAGVYLRQYGTVRNSIIRNDTIMTSSNIHGGGVYMDNGTLDNCEIYGNFIYCNGSLGGGVYANYGTITNCDIHDNKTQGHTYYSNGGGVYAYHANLSGCFIHGNEASGWGGGLYIYGSSENNRSLLDDCRIEGNTANYAGGVDAHYTRITNCIIANNTATGHTGGVYTDHYCYIINCAIVNNMVNGSGGSSAGLYVNGTFGSTVLVNSVVWGNRKDGTVSNINDGRLAATYCAVESAFPGTGNIQLSSLNTGSDMSPMFTAPTEGVGADFTGGDWTLQEGSILINLGDNSVANLPDHDFLGNDRIQQDRVDIGPYETPYTSSIVITPDANNIIYVSVEGAGTQDGSSWANAASNPNFVIAMASMMSPLPTIWMKEGTYVGDSLVDGNAFVMYPSVNVYGGFAGTETTLEERDYASHPTILDGQRVQRVLCQSAAFTEATAAVWDGFIIENGRLTSETDGAGVYLRQYGTVRNSIIRNDTIISSNSDLCGGGVYMHFGTLDNCEIYGNYVSGRRASGGGVYSYYGCAIDNCHIHNNSAWGNDSNNGSGGGLYVYVPNSTDIRFFISNCRIENNSVNGDGGGACLRNSNMVNCSVTNNTARYGGGLYTKRETTVTSCNIANNTATSTGGGMYNDESYTSSFINNNVVNNLVTTNNNSGGGIYTSSSTIVYTNCVVWGNRNNENPDQYRFYAATPSLTYCAIQGGYDGTGNINLSADNEGELLSPYFTAPTEGAGATYSGGDWSLGEESCLINQGISEGLTLPETDLAGNPRIQHGIIDMGPYESPYNVVVIMPDEHGIIYVKPEACGDGSGSSWENATGNLQLAVNRAGAFGITTVVWVAQGTYYGDGVVNSKAFVMAPGIHVFGSFVGDEAYDYDLSQRDMVNHATILDGQGVQRTLYQPSDFAADRAAVWDGFSLTNGGGNNYGPGAYLQSNGELRNCRIYGNSGGNYSGAVYAQGNSAGDARLTNCHIFNNVTQYGGVYAYRTTLQNCLIEGNSGSNSCGAMWMAYNVTVLHCGIYNNMSTNSVIYVQPNSGNRMINCVIWGNSASQPFNNPRLVALQCCAVEGGAFGEGNICLSSANTGDVMSPCFTDPASGDWTLQSNSILINKGMTVADYPETDMAGNTRIQQGVPDLGPFESSYNSSYDIVADANGIVYVSVDGTGDGSSWANACGDLQFAVNRAATMSPVPEVWVKRGSYYSELFGMSNAFCFCPGVNVYGGFAGTEDATFDKDNRDFFTNPTILDGLGEKRVLYQQDNFTEDKQATWDGFSIRNGYTSNEDGAGVYMRAYSHLKNCIIMNNSAGARGGGVYCYGNSTLTNCEIKGNISHGVGGGVYIESATMTNCKVTGNMAQDNRAGGGVYADYAHVINCEIADNEASYAGGLYNRYSNVVNTTIVNNRGGGTYFENNSQVATNLIIWGNTGEQVAHVNNGITNSAIQGGFEGTGNIALNEENDGVGVGNYVRFLAPELGIYQLRDDSPLIGMGDSGVSGLPEKDLAGRDRIMGGGIEPGAYEQYCTEYEYVTFELESGGVFDFYGSQITQPGTYMHQYSYSSTCDSLIVAEVIMNSAVWYVTTTGAGRRDGSSWANASNDLNATLNYAARQTGYDSKQVWVAEGTYTGNASGTHFFTVGSVEVYGGFAGHETHISQRDIVAHPTILSGTSNRTLLNLSSTFPCSEEQTSLWDGFIMQGAKEIMVGQYVTLKNCFVGIPTVANGTLLDCDFTGFSNDWTQIFVRLNNGAVMDSCRVHHNLCCYALVRAQDATIRYSVFHNNTCNRSDWGGENGMMFGAILNAIDNVTIDHCDFVNNRVESTSISPSLYVNMEGLNQPKHTIIALHNSTMKNSIVWGNEQTLYTRHFIAKDLASNVDYCAIEGGLYNGVGNIALSLGNEDGLFAPAFNDPITGTGHLISIDDYDLSLKSTSICLKQGEGGSDIGAFASTAPAVVSVEPSADHVIYVDAEGTGNGTSWSNATPHLQYAVARANTFEPVAQVWVKEGTYYGMPTAMVIDSLAPAFNVVENVNVYGGFAGTENSLEDRNIADHPTYLDGRHAQRVLYQSEPLTDTTAVVWDGFVIRNGYMKSKAYYGYSAAFLSHPYNSSYNLLQLHGAGATLKNHITLSHTSFEGNRIARVSGYGNYNLPNEVKGTALSMLGGHLDHVSIAYDTTDYVSSANSMLNSYLYAINAQIDSCNFNHNIGKIALYGCTVDATCFEYNQVRPELPSMDDLNEAELYADATTMRHCRFSYNNAVVLSRNITSALCANTYLNCQIDHNNAMAVVKHSNSYNDTFINCNICNNRSTNSNTSYIISGGIFHNCVAWGNRNFSDAPAHFNGFSLESVTFNHCAVEMGIDGSDDVITLASSNMGTSQAYAYPCFLAPNAGDYELTNASALIDAGDGSVVDFDYDMHGNPRLNDSVVDIGAYEYKCTLYREYSDFTTANAYPFYGEWLTESGQYTHRWAISAECDSLVVLNLSFKRIIYVTENGGGLMNGTSWENAFGDLRLATEASGENPMDRTQIWVAEGVYRGDGTSVNAFKLYPNVEMYGGLTGTELADYDLSQRDLANHVTVLDGDYIQRVLYMVDDCTEETACVIDGFTIKNGYSRQDVNAGTALYLKKHVHVRNCKITENYTWSGASAIYMKTDYMEIAETKVIINTFENCEINNNQGAYAVLSDHTSFTNCKISANDGYGVHILTYTRFDNCEFVGNGTNNNCNGYGVYRAGNGFYKYVTPMGADIISRDFMDMTNCVVKNNKGSGIFDHPCCQSHADAEVMSCVIANNRANKGDNKRGGAIFHQTSDFYITCSTIVNNQAQSDGGGLYGTGFHIVNTILSGNRAGSNVNQFSNHCYEVIYGCNIDGSPMIINTIQTTDIRYSAIEGGYPGEGNIVLNGDDLLVSFNGFRLRENSACINQGTTEGITIPEYDLGGQSRVLQGRIDIGAYESDYTGRTLIQPDANNIIYVSREGSVTNDGSSWENATSHFQMALNFALCYDPKPQVWVKEGVYDNLETENAQFWSDLGIMPGVQVYGGFGGTEPANFNLDNRQLNNHLSILDGKNLRRVLEQMDDYTGDDCTVWDGFTIRNGYAEKGYTSNIHYLNESSVISSFGDYMNGGGVMLRQGVSIDNCDIYDNVAYKGGGIYRDGVTGPANYLRNDKIRRNYAIDEGGGLYYQRAYGILWGENAIDTIANCEISGNTSDRHAAAFTQRVNFINCSFIKNKTDLYSFDTITSNHVYNRYVNCVLWGNECRNYPWQTDGRHNTYEYCAIQDGHEGTGNVNLELENTGDDPSLNYPFFIDVDEEVYQPSENSAFINVGNNDDLYGDKDLAYHDRVKDDIVDMGAYEQACLNYRHMRVISNGSFVFYGRLLTESGKYQYQWTPDGMDCDSLVSVDLEIRKIWYVRQNGAGTRDGSSWENAMANPKDALSAAANFTTNATKQIWVAKGTYAGDGNSTQAFRIVPNVGMYGGFNGNEPLNIDIDDRRPDTARTILDGSHSQRVIGNYGSENSFGPTSRAHIDGFVIQNGYTTGNGGGVYAYNYITIKNCVIQYNQGGNGAGVYLDNRCEVSDCDIYRNTALHNGGGAYVRSSTLTYCRLHNNLCDNVSSSGTRHGGGIYGQNATINNCLIDNNSALTDKAKGGGMYIANSSVASQLLNCTMVHNYSYNLAGGVFSENSYSNNEFINCVLWGNRTDLNNQQVAVSSTNVPIYMRYCAVQGGCAGIGTITLPADNNSSSIYAPHFIAPTANVGANYEGGNWHFADGSILANHGERMSYTLTHDLDGEGSARIKNDRIDIGAFESNSINDYCLVPDANNTIYVNAANTGGNLSGNSWANALPDLQMAINFAGDDDNHPKVWIAQGTYLSNGWPYADAFIAMNGIDLYGGFVGNEPADYDLNQRDFAAHQTILDGQNIQRTLQQAKSDYFKYRQIESQQWATYDGITIRNGFVYAKDGANVLMWKGDLRNCIVENGHAMNGSSNGGGISGNDNVRVFSTIFRNNKTEGGYSGGAGYGAITYYNCLFANNSALNCRIGGGATNGGTHYNSTIVNNYSSGDGGGVYSGSVYNSILWGNKVGDNEPCNLKTADLNQGNPYSSMTVRYSAIEGGYLGEGNISLNANNTGSGNINYPMFAQPSIAAGADYHGGDWTLLNGSVCVNHGNNNYVLEGCYDLTNQERIQNEIVDMGCYESPYNFDFEIVPDAANIIYVTQEGAGLMNGSSWANATSYLQFALERADLYNPKPTIWMAEGIYTGDGVPYNPAFLLPVGINIHGGFLGNEPASYDITQRNFDTLHVTALDGQNLQQIMRRDNTNSTYNYLTGLTFQNGRSIRYGGAASLNHCQLEDCKFVNNAYVRDDGDGGGALYAASCNIYRCEFTDNYSIRNGGAIYNHGSNVFNWCKIRNNTAVKNGGGIMGGSYLYNCEISFNHAEGTGGGVQGIPMMRNCDVVKNTVNVSSNNNDPGSYGGGVYIAGSYNYSQNHWSNNIIWGNRAGSVVSNIRGANFSNNIITYTGVESDLYFPGGVGNIMLQSANTGEDASLDYVRFADPDNGDFTLMETPQSMCIDAGNNDYAAPGDYDLDGNERIRNGVVDMGCYEQTPVDCHAPINLEIPEDLITFTTADVNWTPGEDESHWLVYYMQVGSASPHIVTVDTNYIQLMNLHPNLRYMVKVRSMCDNSEMSAFTIPQYFNTACDPDSIVWNNDLAESGLLPLRDQALPSNSTVLFSWDYIEGVDYYDLYLWRTDHGNGLPIPDFPVRRNIRNNYTTVNLARSEYDGHGVYEHCMGWGCDPEPPAYLYQNDTTGVAYYAWYVVAHKDCASIQSDTMAFNTGLPDLHVSALDNSYAQTGQMMTVTWSVRNDGNVPTPTGATWTDYIVLSYPINWEHSSFTAQNPESFVIAEVPNLIALDTNMQYTNEVNVFVPDNMYGSVFLFVLSNWQKYSDMHLDFAPYGGVFPNPYTPDPSGYPYYYMSGTCSSESFAEINECDNFFYKQIEVDIPPYPDLIAREVIPPYESVAGDSITISWKLINQGAAGFENVAITDIVYMTTDTIFSGQAITLGTLVDTITLMPGDTLLRHATFATNERDIDTFNFYVRTDATNAVYESLFEGNNMSPVSEHSTILLPAPPPDLAFDEIYLAADTLSPNEWFRMRYKVANHGYVAAKPNAGDNGAVDTCGVVPPWRGVRWTDKVYISEVKTPEAIPNPNTFVGSRYNDTILYSPTEISQILTMVQEWADCHYDLPDTLSANASHADSVRYAQLVAQAQTNKQNYLERTLPLYKNSYLQSFRVKIPEGAQEGLYYYYVKTDSEDQVFEYQHEGNNIILDSIYVVQPDLKVFDIAISEDRDHVDFGVTNVGSGKLIDSYTSVRVNFNNSQVGSRSLRVDLDPYDTLWLQCPVVIPCNFFAYNSLKVQVTPSNDKDFTNNNLVIENYQLFNPDFLAVSSSLEAPVELNSGENFDIQYNISNLGDIGYEGELSLGVYLGLSPELNFITATQLKLETQPVLLDVGGTTTVQQNLTLPIELEGQYYLYIVVNDGDAVCEGDNVQSNYIVSPAINVSLAPYPDLYVTDASTPGSGTAGNTATVSYTVTNQGIRAVTSSESWSDAIYVSNSPTFSTSSAELLSVISRNGPLAIGETYTVERNVTLPVNLASDNYFIYIVCDKNDDLFEYVGEYNNVYQSASFPVEEYSLDLAVDTLFGSTEIEWNQMVSYTYTVTNHGSRPTVSNYYDRIYLSTDATFDGSDMQLYSSLMDGVGAGGSYTRTREVHIPYGYTGTYYILVVTDATGQNPDSNPDNNVRALQVNISTIPVPDLEVSDVTIITEYPACGQPIRVSYKVTNVGDGPTYGTYVDRAVYSRNTFNSGTQFANITRSDTLQPGEYYYDTLSFIVSVPNTGNYAVYISANHNETMFEMNRENNISMVPVVVSLNAPGDLIVANVDHPTHVTAGEPMTITWKVRNLGPNELSGVNYSDVVYLSTDTIFDSNDKLLGNLNFDNSLIFRLYTDVEHSMTVNISGVQEGDYYIIVLADARNTFYEENENNNRGYSVTPFSVELPILPFNTPVTFDMANFQYKDFKLPVGTNISETVRIYVRSNDSLMGAVNNIYVLKDAIGTNLNYDLSTDGQMTSNSELYIARTEAGYYGVSVLGYSPVNTTQQITIEADILPFEIRSVSPNYGGNTGKTTVKLVGSKFRHDMEVQLFRINGNDTIRIFGDTLMYRSFNEVFVTFDLTGAELGLYSLRADNYCAGSAYLHNCFTVVEGEPENLATNLIIPVGLRANRYCMLTLEYGNIGNTDIVNPRIRLRSEGGSWIGLRRGELNIHRTELDIPTDQFTDEPEGILRPGVRHTINIYCYTNAELHFYIDVDDEIEIHEYIKNIMMR